MQITTVMVVIFLIWCPITMLLRGTAQTAARARSRAICTSATTALGWFKGTIWPQIRLRRDHHRLRPFAAFHERL